MKEFCKEDLEKLYIKELKTTREIAKIYQCSPHTVVRRLRSFNIEVRPTGNYKDKEYHFVSPLKQVVNNDEELISLFNAYTPLREIAKKLGVCVHAVERRIKELKLTRDNGKMMSRDFYDSSKDEIIKNLYEKGKSTTEIGSEIGVSHTYIMSHLEHMGIKRRTLSDSQFAYKNKKKPKELDSYEELFDLYVIDKLSKKDIGKLLSVDPGTVNTALMKFNIPIRGNSEAKKGLYIGKDAGNYKDGRTPLYMRLRMYFRIWQARERLKIDKRTCQICGSKKKLHVHHIRPFKEIFEEILSEHKELDVQKDSDVLYEIMVNDSRMNNISNLITYCKECHLFKVHGYKKKGEKNLC